MHEKCSPLGGIDLLLNASTLREHATLLFLNVLQCIRSLLYFSLPLRFTSLHRQCSGPCSSQPLSGLVEGKKKKKASALIGNESFNTK